MRVAASTTFSPAPRLPCVDVEKRFHGYGRKRLRQPENFDEELPEDRAEERAGQIWALSEGYACGNASRPDEKGAVIGSGW